jgi:hypothetical protein
MQVDLDRQLLSATVLAMIPSVQNHERDFAASI